MAPLDRPFRRLDNSQSISVTLAELSSDGADYVSMEGYGFFRRNLVPTTRNGTVTKHPSLGTIRATEYIADIGATAHLIGANVLGAGLAARPANNHRVWAGGTQVLLTASEQMSPDVGPRALKIPSMITEFVAASNATLAGSLEEGRQPDWLL